MNQGWTRARPSEAANAPRPGPQRFVRIRDASFTKAGGESITTIRFDPPSEPPEFWILRERAEGVGEDVRVSVVAVTAALKGSFDLSSAWRTAEPVFVADWPDVSPTPSYVARRGAGPPPGRAGDRRRLSVLRSYFFLETLRVFFAVFFTADFAFFAFFAFFAISPS
jgi:hypothetical protein